MRSAQPVGDSIAIGPPRLIVPSASSDGGESVTRRGRGFVMSAILAVKRYVSLRLARALGLAQFEERLKALSEEVALQARTLAEREAQLSETFGALDCRLEAIRQLRAEVGRVNSRLIEFA